LEDKMKITNLGMASVIGMIAVIGGIAINNILFPPQHEFDVPDRNILITNLQDNKIKISFDGVWSEEDSGKKLAESLERHEFIESVLEQDGVRLVIKCQ
jgi:hypothetical protein